METDDLIPSETQSEAPPGPRPKAPPIESRFLFVDIAAMRAKQLRRGALPRIEPDEHHKPLPHKPERVAMEEVKQCLVLYEVPETTSPAGQSA